MSTVPSIDVEMLATLPVKALLAYVAKQRDTRRFFEQSLKAIQEHAALFLMLEETGIDVRFDPDYLTICIGFAGDGQRLGQVWGELRRHGFNCETRPKKGDVDFHGYFQQDGYPKLMVNFTSTLCRRVQVGTQTVEQPIYETICGELGELPEGAAPSAPAPETPAIEGIPPPARNGSETSPT